MTYPELATYLRAHEDHFCKMQHDLLAEGPRFGAVIYSCNEGGFFGQGWGATIEEAMEALEADVAKVNAELLADAVREAEKRFAEESQEVRRRSSRLLSETEPY